MKFHSALLLLLAIVLIAAVCGQTSQLQADIKIGNADAGVTNKFAGQYTNSVIPVVQLADQNYARSRRGTSNSGTDLDVTRQITDSFFTAVNVASDNFATSNRNSANAGVDNQIIIKPSARNFQTNKPFFKYSTSLESDFEAPEMYVPYKILRGA